MADDGFDRRPTRPRRAAPDLDVTDFYDELRMPRRYRESPEDSAAHRPSRADYVASHAQDQDPEFDEVTRALNRPRSNRAPAHGMPGSHGRFDGSHDARTPRDGRAQHHGSSSSGSRSRNRAGATGTSAGRCRRAAATSRSATPSSGHAPTHADASWQRAHKRDVQFRRSILWTLLAAIIPGLGLSRSSRPRRRAFGMTLTAVALVAAFAAGITLWVKPTNAAAIAVRPGMLLAIVWALPIMAVALTVVLILTHLDLRPHGITRAQRWISSIVVAALTLMISGPMAVASRYAYDDYALLNRIFGDAPSATRPDIDTHRSVKDIWASKPRVNVLLVGADDTKQRHYRDRGEMNTDTIMVASIDTRTGNGTIIQIPRNTAAMPFPENSKLHTIYPEGFTTGHGDDSKSFANAIWSTVEAEHSDAIENTKYPGADALKMAVGEGLGLSIDYFLMIDIDGLQKLIDSLGGVTVNINQRLPIAGNSEGKPPTGYLEVGPEQHLNGYNAMWYARSRSESSDYDRMGRQSCLMKAVLDQTNPETVLTRFEAIADASGDMVVSDIPQGMLPAFVDLAMRMQDANLNRLLFVNGKNGFQPWDPNYPMMREQVAETIARASDSSNANKPVTGKSARPSATKSKKAAPKPGSHAAEGKAAKGTSAPTSASPTPKDTESSLTDVCGFHPIDEQNR